MSGPRGNAGASTAAVLGLLSTNTIPPTDKIKTDLLAYCHEVDKALDERSGNIGKYLKVPPLLSDDKAADADSNKRKAFLESVDGQPSGFDKLYPRLVTALDKLTSADIETIGTGKPNENAREFLACIEELNQAGFYNVNGKPINFWSGDEAQEKANNTLTSLSDSNIPATSIVIKLGNLYKEQAKVSSGQEAEIADARSKKLFSAGSAAFTEQAVGNVEVYMSAYNEKELPSLPAGNFHWDHERNILERRKEEKLIDNVGVSFLDRTHDKWKNPVDLNDKSIRVLHKDRKDIPEDKNERKIWLKGDKVRKPGVKIGKLIQYVKHWKTVAHDRAETKKLAEDKKPSVEPIKQHRRNVSEGQPSNENSTPAVSNKHRRNFSR